MVRALLWLLFTVCNKRWHPQTAILSLYIGISNNERLFDGNHVGYIFMVQDRSKIIHLIKLGQLSHGFLNGIDYMTAHERLCIRYC